MEKHQHRHTHTRTHINIAHAHHLRTQAGKQSGTHPPVVLVKDKVGNDDEGENDNNDIERTVAYK